ncbi:MAG: hypothetical protein DSY55_00075 [Clostridia bacterium]|nr:MAG: hypothetical protein DSY55_00075 [Clostridia bacterium]
MRKCTSLRTIDGQIAARPHMMLASAATAAPGAKAPKPDASACEFQGCKLRRITYPARSFNKKWLWFCSEYAIFFASFFLCALAPLRETSVFRADAIQPQRATDMLKYPISRQKCQL